MNYMQEYEKWLRSPALSPEEKARAGAYGRQVIFDYYSVRRMACDCLAVYDQVRRRKYRVVMSGPALLSKVGAGAEVMPCVVIYSICRAYSPSHHLRLSGILS